MWYAANLAQALGGALGRAFDGGRPQAADALYAGDVYVLTLGLTFSSGNWIAVILQDNGLARVVGEPTGNRPSAYGEDLPFQMARTGLRFTVSSKQWTRPAPERDPANTLMPDIPIPTTIHDVRVGRDPQIEWVWSGS